MVIHFKRMLLSSWISIMGTLLCPLLLTGCATSMSRVPQKSPTMLQVYNAAMHESSGNSITTIRKQLPLANVSSNEATSINFYDKRMNSRSMLNTVNQKFPLLPNPEIELYVYPHLAEQSEVPVMGYPTAFTLYKKDHFALPGELRSPTQSRRG